MQIIYGKNSVETYLTFAPEKTKTLLLLQGLQEKTAQKFIKLAKAHNIPIKNINKQMLSQYVKADEVHQGILAQVEDFAYADLHTEIVKAQKNTEKLPLFVVVDQLQDPRNLGAILRTADCVGIVDAIIIAKHDSVKVTATVIKTSTGAALQIPIIQVTNIKNALQTLKKAGVWICGLDMVGAANYRKQAYDLPLCVVIGGEDAGVRPIVKKETDFNVFIPMNSKVVNSLNVSVATSLLLYEVMHQRSN